jgi:hypothetical protein
MHVDQNDSGRNARQQFSPHDRTRVCRAIHRQIALEYLHGKASKREAWARLAIGLPPIPRPLTEGVAA